MSLNIICLRRTIDSCGCSLGIPIYIFFVPWIGWLIKVSPMFLCNRIHHHLPVMGLTKQYLRYAASAVFGVIGSQKANIAYVTLRGGERGRYVAVAACEHVFIWDVRKGEKVRLFRFVATLETPFKPRWFPDFNQRLPFCLFCPGSDPAGPETRGDLPLPLTRWRPYRRGLRGWCCADI